MRSMTGYGRASLLRDGRELTLELKTVNHRFLDLNIRLPRQLLFLEDCLRKGLNARLARGHVDVFINYRNTREDAREVCLDGALLQAYAGALEKAAALLPQVHDDRSLMRLVMMPDVLSVSEQAEDQDAVRDLCVDVLKQACDSLEEMRVREGQSIAKDMTANLEAQQRTAREIAVRAPCVAEDYRVKLNDRIAEILQAPVDTQRLEQEVAIFADRAAIDEELVRLSSHFAQFRRLLCAQEPVGRKLDFLVQEMNREVNTIGSKASDLEIGRRVVEAKAEIEKIREQVQNIE